MTVKSKKDYANKVLQMDPLSERLNAAGFTGGASRTYLKSLKTTAKPLINKSLKTAPLETRNFKGVAGAPISVKKQLLTVNKLQKVNQENLMFDRANPNLIRNTKKILKKVENDIRLDFRKTDQGKKNTKQDSEFRKFLREQKARRTISTDFS
jgi:hypothetical protein|tara:strand:+ start:102 stop:560 length:459 start_codon:yes stop_codon:yes gene_type:complete